MTDRKSMARIKPQNISIEVRLRASESKKSLGMGNVYLQIIIDSEPDRIPLAIQWPLDKFDVQTGKLLARHPDDTLCYDNNVIISKNIATAYDIRAWYRICGRKATCKDFKRLFSNPNSRNEFLEFCIAEIPELKKEGICSLQSEKLYNSCFESVREFIRVKNDNKPICFVDITEGFFSAYDSYFRNKKKNPLMHNTIVGRIKIMKKFLRRAKKQKIAFDDGVFDFKAGYISGDLPALDQDELKVVTAHAFKRDFFTDLEAEVLAKFAFSCYTGLRISDSNQLHQKHIHKGILNLSLLKGKRFGKEITMELPSVALKILEGRKGLIFQPITDSLVNKTLKTVFSKMKLDIYVSFHVSRHTFATIYLELGGDILSLSELMGHSSIKVTEKYLRTREKTKKTGMMAFNAFA